MKQEDRENFIETFGEFCENPEKMIITVDGDDYIREDAANLANETSADIAVIKTIFYTVATIAGIWAVKGIRKKLFKK